MSEIEILEEQQKLFQSLDPKLIEFLTERRSKQSAENSKMDVDHQIEVKIIPKLSKINPEIKTEDGDVIDLVNKSVTGTSCQSGMLIQFC